MRANLTKSEKHLYGIWIEMRARCNRKTKDSYARYGGRGIKVYDDWNSWEHFRDWALINGYKDELTIERIDVNGDYAPDNCTFIPKSDQAKNRRSSIFLTHDGMTFTTADWSRRLGFRNKGAIASRLRAGWSVEEALTTPPKKYKICKNKDDK